MKVSELTDQQLEIIAEERPYWVANNRLTWMLENRLGWVLKHRPGLVSTEESPSIRDLIGNDEVPSFIINILDDVPVEKEFSSHIGEELFISITSIIFGIIIAILFF